MIAVVLVLLVVSSMALPFVMIGRWNDKAYVSGDGIIVDSDIFNVANYCGENYDSRVSMSNAEGMSGLIWSVSGIAFSGPGISSLLTGEVTSEAIENGIEPSDRVFPHNLYSWLSYEESPLLIHFESKLMRQGLSYLYSSEYYLSTEFSQYLIDHSRLVIYIDNNWPDSYVTAYADRNATLPSELRDSESATEHAIEPGSFQFASYLVYETGRSSVYVVQLPVSGH